VTLYTLRHTHASLLHYAGFTAPEAAARMGHGLPVHWSRYAHIVNGQHGKRYDGSTPSSPPREPKWVPRPDSCTR